MPAGEWKDDLKVRRREFPGPRGASKRLRVAFEREAYADFLGHAKESLNAEVCGVLAGEVCEDDDGLFVHIRGAVRGGKANEGATHVTFTQDTWTTIHDEMDRSYPKLRIMGWYHTHPGFGVEFSEMDLFIQRSFFSSPTQIAVVTDPLSGEEAICVNTENDGIQYLDRFCVEGRERKCLLPKRDRVKEAPTSDAGSHADRDLEQLEMRLSQTLQAMDELRSSVYRLLAFVGAVACAALVFLVGSSIYDRIYDRAEPPKLKQYVPVPITIGDQQVLLGVAVVDWIIPEELREPPTPPAEEEVETDLPAEAVDPHSGPPSP